MQKYIYFYNVPRNRWWVYQRERFPLIAYALLVFVFSIAAIGYSHVVAGQIGIPDTKVVLVSFVGSFIIFALLRIADEFKDFDDDVRYRPYRAVPRGLVTLSELGALGVVLATVQLGLALAYSSELALLLLVVWAYFLLMSKEFFVPTWLKAHPVAYLTSHMLIMPLIALYASAPVWLDSETGMPNELPSFLIMSFFIGIACEIGRKIRAPKDEEPGVETYSALWGRGHALVVWFTMLLVAGGLALKTAQVIGMALPLSISLVVLFSIALGVALKLILAPQTRYAKAIELISGLWALAIYGSLGLAAVVPTLIRT